MARVGIGAKGYKYNSVNWLKRIKWLEIYIQGNGWKMWEGIGENWKGGMEGGREGGGW